MTAGLWNVTINVKPFEIVARRASYQRTAGLGPAMPAGLWNVNTDVKPFEIAARRAS